MFVGELAVTVSANNYAIIAEHPAAEMVQLQTGRIIFQTKQTLWIVSAQSLKAGLMPAFAVVFYVVHLLFPL